jgi:hypothetical protein
MVELSTGKSAAIVVPLGRFWSSFATAPTPPDNKRGRTRRRLVQRSSRVLRDVSEKSSAHVLCQVISGFTAETTSRRGDHAYPFRTSVNYVQDHLVYSVRCDSFEPGRTAKSPKPDHAMRQDAPHALRSLACQPAGQGAVRLGGRRSERLHQRLVADELRQRHLHRRRVRPATA